MRRFGGAFVLFLAVVVGAGSLSSATTAGTSIPACSTGATGTLVPTLQDFSVNQGLESYTSTLGGVSSGRLARGKETLVRPYFTLPSTCSGTIALAGATLTATIGGSSHSYSNYGGTGVGSLAAAVTVNGTVDPLFVVPAADLAPGNGSATFTVTWSVTLSFTQNRNGAVVSKTYTGAPIPAATTFEMKTNALRILVVPMGDASQSFSSQFPGAAQTDIQNAMSTLSRIYPVPAGIGDLTGSSGGIRYTIDLAAMVNLRAVSGAYDASNRFCGSQVNFDAIKAQLAQFLQSWNTQNPAATADRVVGAVYGGDNGVTTFGISDGGAAGCAEGMAGVNSQVAWVRAIDDVTGRNPVNSWTGGVLAMEMSHTFGLVPPSRSTTYHSANVAADIVAPTGRAYNITSRSFVVNSHSVMRYDTSTSPFDNTDTLLEARDYNDLLCFLTPGSATNPDCATTGVAGTATGVSAGPMLVGSGTTDGTAAGTSFVESYYATNVAPTADCATSPYHMLQLSAGQVQRDDGICVETLTSDHDHAGGAADLNDTSGVFSFALTAVGADEIEFTYNGTVLYDRHEQASAPSVSAVSTTQDFGPLGFKAPVVPPTPDILILADTTGSMGTALTSVKNGLTTAGTGIIPTIVAQRPQAAFGAANYRDVDCDPSTGYVLNQAITTTSSAVDTAVGNWSAPPGAGCDVPEDQLNALYQIATNPTAVGWRAGSSRIVVWFGDSSGHDPSPLTSTNLPQHSLVDVANALVAANIRVVAVPVDGAALGGDGLDNPVFDATLNASVDQPLYLTQQTGGELQPLTSAADVAAAITSGLQNLPVTLGASTSCDNENISLTLGSRRPSEDPIPSGAAVSYSDVVAHILPGTPAGTYHCTVSFTVNGNPDDALTRHYDVPVAPTFSSGGLELTAQSATPDNLRADVFYLCGGAQYPVAVGLVPTQVGETQATFSAHFDSTIACGGSAGQLVAYVTDGFGRGAGPPATPGGGSPGANPPTAAIYAPFSPAYAPGATVQYFGTGNSPQTGKLPSGDLHWKLGSTDLPTGNAGTLQLPTAPGAYTLTLTATDTTGSGSDSRTLTVVAPPSLSITHVPVGPTTTASSVTFTVSAEDDASGLASIACSFDGASIGVPAPAPGAGVPYSASLPPVTDYGTHTVQCTATANDGLTASADDQSQILYVFGGFLQPIDNPPTVNTGKPGKTYPVKWQLTSASGAFFSNLAIVRSITYKAVPCTTLSSTSDAIETTTTGGTAFRYDSVANQYVYNWQTPSAAGCYELDVSLNDDTVHKAYFKLS